MTGLTLAVAMILAAPAALPIPVRPPLQPSGKWLVEGQDNMCALSHAYGEGKDSVTLGFRPWPMEDLVDVIWFSHSIDSSVRDGTAQLHAEPGNVQARVPYTSFALTGQSKRLSSFTIGRELLPALEQSRTVTVGFDGKETSVAPAGMKAALAALSGCEALLYKSLGVDPASRDRMASPPTPKGNQGAWFSANDYPPEARHGGAQGRTLMLLTVGTDGRIANCVPFGRSGNIAIDRASCSAYLSRGRFKPAIGKDGQPMIGYFIGRVHWVLE